MDAKIYFQNRKNIQLIIQTTWACNIRCKHCYESNSNYPNMIMNQEILEKLIKLSLKQYSSVSYLWFGGEPLMAGLDFFKKVVELQNKYATLYGKREIKNSIQTNLILLTDKMIEFFKLNDFGISVSYDGIYNNILRQGTLETENNIKKAQKAGLRVNVLSVIHAGNYDKQYSMYKDLQAKGLKAKFNRIFAEGNAKKFNQYLVSNEEYINETKRFFLQWMEDTDARGFSNFDICFGSLYNLNFKECTFSGCMFKWIAISPNGDTYTCPRFMGAEYNFGNILNIDNLYDLFYSEKYMNLAKKAIVRRKKCKKQCKLYFYCNGGCNAQCYFNNGVEEYKTDLCEYVKNFFPFVAKTMYEATFEDKSFNPIVKDIITNYKDRVISVYEFMLEEGLFD